MARITPSRADIGTSPVLLQGIDDAVYEGDYLATKYVIDSTML